MAQQRQKAAGAREGSRWVNQRPSGEEVASWFKDNVQLHEGLEHDHYVQGVTLIPSKETLREAVEQSDGSVKVMDTGEQLVYVPYAKVETRVAYFWDYVRLNPEWVGAIERIPVRSVETPGYFNVNLPPGFFRQQVQKSDGKFVDFIGCSFQVRIFERDIRAGGRGRVVVEPPAGTKVVPALDRWGKPDESALMKAETGAVGRALGMAGMLVIPGSGVATAEDMQEIGQGTAAVDPAAAAELPQEAQAEAQDERKVIDSLIGQLQEDHPEAHQEFVAWAREKKIDPGNVTDTQLRAVRRQLERKLQAASAVES